jgi:hypothetical protein
MNAEYHVRITVEALADRFGPGTLPIVVRSNLRQDRLINLVGHPQFHFDGSAFAESERYIERQRTIAVWFTVQGNRPAALQAFGRLLHCRQDFYAHSNWIARWAKQNDGSTFRRPEDIDICTDPLTVPGLLSCKGSARQFLAVRVPLAGRLYRRWLLPDTSHEAMNLDDPSRGPLFPFAVAAAIKHTRLELDLLLALLERRADKEAVGSFLGTSRSVQSA